MSIAVENLPRPHRRRFEYLVPHRYRAATAMVLKTV
jgi:hypothetical protein